MTSETGGKNSMSTRNGDHGIYYGVHEGIIVRHIVEFGKFT